MTWSGEELETEEEELDRKAKERGFPSFEAMMRHLNGEDF